MPNCDRDVAWIWMLRRSRVSLVLVGVLFSCQSCEFISFLGMSEYDGVRSNEIGGIGEIRDGDVHNLFLRCPYSA